LSHCGAAMCNSLPFTEHDAFDSDKHSCLSFLCTDDWHPVLLLLCVLHCATHNVPFLNLCAVHWLYSESLMTFLFIYEISWETFSLFVSFFFFSVTGCVTVETTVHLIMFMLTQWNWCRRIENMRWGQRAEQLGNWQTELWNRGWHKNWAIDHCEFKRFLSITLPDADQITQFQRDNRTHPSVFYLGLHM